MRSLSATVALTAYEHNDAAPILREDELMERADRDQVVENATSSTRRRTLLKASLGIALGGALASIGLGETQAARRLRGDWETCRENCDCESGVCKIAKDGRRRCIPESNVP